MTIDETYLLYYLYPSEVATLEDICNDFEMPGEVAMTSMVSLVSKGLVDTDGISFWIKEEKKTEVAEAIKPITLVAFIEDVVIQGILSMSEYTRKELPTKITEVNCSCSSCTELMKEEGTSAFCIVDNRIEKCSILTGDKDSYCYIRCKGIQYIAPIELVSTNFDYIADTYLEYQGAKRSLTKSQTL